ncbi:CAMP-dependent protein kinase regulatory subunit, putative [Plasmodium berghei]|uniref:cAMP-dependent protein kinase regulatory subunit, putative n=2 Tax=Plasmodium berghei TaxID=5821 RepID=A0A509AVF6_PLABA|nr:cAMP-dependent protein kinase regulatory subunit, putative [Plasmodium berghei ANKA]CXJ22035.1 CAMP-dependent protein kinase regulatory subunit, putative [Plasmodium berghei]SCM26637.1 CAMP-dependent protein kinase regulatory subunit, putative [Plasmodium berghei]SCN28559.1 CAMP-dependent protein kinase regulatory subunit, putative [Plasmodium berghei]SCO62748.1 CAMP-dependent protein kinase regulatory subunit, putative [Plasmodium berghei]SCO64308.1 CAMP-dependent protein kinase regulatory|eukprot:XP_034424204.1 cAMP-dependent protein kinase regulatory subunit, putative [Plasmodium berghei ANKA]
MGNVCTWREGKGETEDKNTKMADSDIQIQFQEYSNKIKNNSKNHDNTDNSKENKHENKDTLANALSLNKRENGNDTINNAVLSNKDNSANVNEDVSLINKNNLIIDECSSDDDETDCLSEVNKKDMDSNSLDVGNMEMRQSKRMSVSAEAYGEWNKKKENFVAKVHKKDNKEKKKIREALNESFLFNHLNNSEMETIIDAFFDDHVEEGANIINEGDEGDLLYVIDEGEIEIYKTKDNKKEVLTTLKSKDVFGELALLYNSKRAATAKALTKCHLWALDRESFTYIIKDNIAKKRQMYEDILKHVTILKDMDPYERSKVADCLKSKTFNAGDVIINEGEQGDTFYILTDGNATALKNCQIIKTYTKGDYFGELALLRNQPRAATVKAESTCQVVYLERKGFKRLLGPIEKILIRNVENYKKVLKELGIDSSCIEEN